MENKNNEAAFPREWSSIKQNKDAPTQYSVAQKGLTKREYLAGLAMQGLLANSSVRVNDINNISECVRIADELLKQLEK